MTNLIPGVDYEVEGVDYDALYLELVRKRKENNKDETESIWNFLDYVFNTSAKMKRGLLCGTDDAFISVEDFCKEQNITSIPELYQYVFKARGGFLTQCKIPWYMRDEWNAVYTQPIPCIYDDLFKKYESYLRDCNDERALIWVRQYLTSEDPDRDLDSENET